MNLHGLASSCTGAVNPSVVATIRISTGSTPQPDGSLLPTYAPATGMVNVQALSGKDLQHLNGLGIQGVTRKAYCRGDINGVVRASGSGGDLLTLPDGTIWLVATVFESWPDWSAVGLIQQLS
jgi:hypothetical protein